MIYFLQKLLLFSIPLREMAGFKSGIPLRMGEILILMYIMYIFIKTNIEKNLKIFNRTPLSKLLVLLLGINLLLTILVSRGQLINNSFFFRYLSRNLMIFLFFIVILIKPIRIKRKDIKLFFKYIVLLQLLMLVLQKCGYTITLFTLVNHPLSRRFQGTASEAGYLPTLIAPALWYFRDSLKNKKYYYLAIFEIFMTFSSFGYAVLGIELIINIYTKKIKIKPKTFLKGSMIFIIILSIIALNFKTVSKAIEFNFNKIIRYSKNDGGDFSARARNQQLKIIKREINKFSIDESILGLGTGSYYFKQLKQVKINKLMEITEEAHNLYYSTIHDRGILGFIILCGIFVILILMGYRQRKNKLVMSLCYLGLLQIIHWKITGNMWLYYFWIGMAINVSQYEFKEYKRNILRRKYERLGKYYNTHLQKKRII